MNQVFAINQLIKELSDSNDLEILDSLSDKERFSKDFFDYSPILSNKLQGCLADLVIRPASVSAVLEVVSACRKFEIPLTLRGSGTGNYGQSVPVNGGVVMLMSSLNNIRDFDSQTGEVTVETGCLLRDVDNYLAFRGRQLRLLPSTWRSASIGGFVAGGSGGIGSVRWGFLRDPGHLQGLEIVTLQENPMILSLDADSSEPLNHAYGTNGIITSLKIATCPAISWQEVVIDSGTLIKAVELLKSCICSAADLYLATLLEDEIVNQLPNFCGESNREHRLLFLVAPDGVNTLKRLATKAGAKFNHLGAENLKSGAGMRELSWNHTTLHMRGKNSKWTYMQMLLPQPEFEAMRSLKDAWKNDLLWHLEAVKQQGVMRLAALPILRWRGKNSMDDFIRQSRDLGAVIFNPHVITVEEGGLGVIDVDQVEAKHLYDPLGILNPGKLKGWLSNDF